jgi:hypothetical protein
MPYLVLSFRQAAINLFRQKLADCPIFRSQAHIVFGRVGVHFDVPAAPVLIIL